MPVQFSTDDLRTPESLERVLRQFQSALTIPTPAPKLPTLAQLVSQLAPLIRDQLQAPGGFPLNLQSLLPAFTPTAFQEDTHANRLVIYPTPTVIGAAFWETDRTVAYIGISSSGALVWRYAAGCYVATFASRPADLGTNDSGFLFYATDLDTIYIWTGAAYDTITRRILFNGGFFAIFAATLTADRTYTLPDETSDFVYKTIAAMTASALVLGDTGGANKTGRVKVLGSLGTTTTLLHGNAAGDPTFAAVSLTADVTGTLPAANGGTGVAYDRIAATVDLTAQTTDIGSTILASTGSHFILAYYLETTTADVAAGTVTLTISWTDDVGATTKTATVVLTGLGALRDTGVIMIQRTSGNVTYSTAHTGVFGTSQYALRMSLERLS